MSFLGTLVQTYKGARAAAQVYHVNPFKGFFGGMPQTYVQVTNCEVDIGSIEQVLSEFGFERSDFTHLPGQDDVFCVNPTILDTGLGSYERTMTTTFDIVGYTIWTDANTGNQIKGTGATELRNVMRVKKRDGNAHLLIHGPGFLEHFEEAFGRGYMAVVAYAQSRDIQPRNLD